MKKIDPTYTTIHKMVCPFCSYGCEFGIAVNDLGIKGVEYLKEGSSEGRLCPRGSAAALLLNHPRRLSVPRKDGATVDWTRMLKDLKKILAKPKQVAVTFDRNLTIEEYGMISGFCHTAGIEYVASTYLEPEAHLVKFFEDPCSLDDIQKAEAIVVIGDPFNVAPMISKSIIAWRLKDKKHRLVVIDSYTTHTTGFATDFLKTKLGSEPVLLYGLAQQPTGGFDAGEHTGIDAGRIQEIAAHLGKTKKGVIIVCLPFGHTYDPLLVAEGITHLQHRTGFKVMPFVEHAGFQGSAYFGELLGKVKKKTIKNIINFGELFPFYYPQLAKELKAANVYATSPYVMNGYTSLPAAMNLEKKGSVRTTFGMRTLTGGLPPASGAYTVGDILKGISGDAGTGKPMKPPAVKIDFKEHAERILEHDRSRKKKFVLVGEKLAYAFLNVYGEEPVKIHPADARKLGVKQHDTVLVKSRQGTTECTAHVTGDVERGMVVVSAETPQVKGLFDFIIDNNIINFIPTEVEVWRKG
jgi:formylmethanofuran dehydrogenase subunit B